MSIYVELRNLLLNGQKQNEKKKRIYRQRNRFTSLQAHSAKIILNDDNDDSLISIVYVYNVYSIEKITSFLVTETHAL